MNDMNQLEKQLESWTPRPPSPKVRRRLFPVNLVPRDQAAPLASLWISVGATACLCFTSIWLALPRHSSAHVFTAVGESNLIAGMTLPERSCQWNLWTAVNFDWTKAGSSVSITGPFGLGRTNL
jgi:hypothetical protein